MDKSKGKGKPSRHRLILATVLMLFNICIVIIIFLFGWINNPRYQVPLLRYIDVRHDARHLVEDRLLEYVTLGETTRAEVEAFGDEYLASTEYPCYVYDETSQVCYFVAIQPMFLCVRYGLRITFQFENDVLSSMGSEHRGSCIG